MPPENEKGRLHYDGLRQRVVVITRNEVQQECSDLGRKGQSAKGKGQEAKFVAFDSAHCPWLFALYTFRVFHLPRLNTIALTTARVENAIVIE